MLRITRRQAITLGVWSWLPVLVLPKTRAIAEESSLGIITGRLLEGCSCSVPCPCNLGQLARPHDFCESLAFFRFNRGMFRYVDLEGLQFALASRGGSEAYLYLAPTISKPQAEVLTKIARWILSFEATPLKEIFTATIRLNFADMDSEASAGSETSLRVSLLKGKDGRTPVSVSHPLIYGAFPVLRSKKGVTQQLKTNARGLKFDYSGTNANDGIFAFNAADVR